MLNFQQSSSFILQITMKSFVINKPLEKLLRKRKRIDGDDYCCKMEM